LKENPSGRECLDMKLMAVQDLIATCPKCGGEVGLWSEDEVTTCIFCNFKVFEKETTEH